MTARIRPIAASRLAGVTIPGWGNFIFISEPWREFMARVAKQAPSGRHLRPRRPRPHVGWSAEMEAQLRTFHADGLTFAQIAQRLAVSRNSVAGKVRRLELAYPTAKRGRG